MLKSWLPFYDPGVPAVLDVPQKALYAYLDSAATDYPQTIACIFKNYKITYKQLQEQAEIFAANLKKNGLQVGDRVALLLPNIPQTLIAFWGILKAGGVVVFINPLYTTKEIIFHCNDSGAKFLIAIDLCWEKILPALVKLKAEKIFITTIADSLAFPLNWLQQFKSYFNNKELIIYYDKQKVFQYSSLLLGKERYSAEIINPAEQLAILQYSSGTTGVPKGAMLTHVNLGMNTYQCKAIINLHSYEEHTFLSVLPFFHVYGLVLALLLPTSLHATIIPMPRFGADEALTLIKKYNVSMLPGAPALYIALLRQAKAKKYNITSLAYCNSGSAPISVELAKEFYKMFGLNIIEGYGLTEASPITHSNPVEGRRKSGTIGIPFPSTEAMIVAPGGHSYVPLPVGTPGELLVRGPQVMKGYWRNPQATAVALHNGWLHTGDIATMDSDGYFTIVDRIKDVVIVGGYNVYPTEVDNVIKEHPSVNDAICVGVPHKTRGEVLKAYVVLAAGQSLSREELLAHCHMRLVRYKVPREIEFRRELPQNRLGKVVRRFLVEEELKKQKEAESLAEETEETGATGEVGETAETNVASADSKIDN